MANISKIKLNNITYNINDSLAVKKIEYTTINKALKVYSDTNKTTLLDTIDLSTLVADSIVSTVAASSAYVIYPLESVATYDNFGIQVKGNDGAAIDFVVDKENSSQVDVRLPMDKSGTIALLSDVTAAQGEAATKYTKPADGIPKSDLAQSVQTSLEKADTAILTETDPTVPSHVKNITTADINSWNNKVSNVLADWNAVSGLAVILNKPNDLASTTYVDNKVAGVVNSAPEALDTLYELSKALGDDPNFATTVSTLIGEKYKKPSTGIPKTDLATAVLTSLGLADSAVQPSDISDMAKKSELTITAGSSSDKKTIQLKSGTSQEVLIAHLDISGKANASDVYTKTQIDNFGFAKLSDIDNTNYIIYSTYNASTETLELTY